MKQNQYCAFLLSAFTTAFACNASAVDAKDIDIDVGGFIRADVGIGDRYGDKYDDDVIGVSKAALAITTQYENIQGVFVLGTEVSTSGKADDDGNIDIKDAFIVINDVMDIMTFSIGAQPLLVGLKPNGYPGDRSLQKSIEYGAAGLFAVSNQAGPSAIAKLGSEELNVRVGIFDQSGYDSTVNEGSGFEDNYFVELNMNNNSGLFASIGYESLYRASTEEGESIIHAGLGYKNETWNLSAELVRLDENINQNSDLDTYQIVEFGYSPTERIDLYLDYSDADLFNTTRLGTTYHLNKHFHIAAEFSKDDLGSEEVKSFDIRFSLEY